MLKKIGDIVVITNNTCHHGFEIGDEVEITEVNYVKGDDYYYYYGFNGNGDQWCFKPEDFS